MAQGGAQGPARAAARRALRVGSQGEPVSASLREGSGGKPPEKKYCSLLSALATIWLVEERDMAVVADSGPTAVADLRRNWWQLLLWGIASVLLGIFLLTQPGTTAVS